MHGREPHTQRALQTALATVHNVDRTTISFSNVARTGRSRGRRLMNFIVTVQIKMPDVAKLVQAKAHMDDAVTFTLAVAAEMKLAGVPIPASVILVDRVHYQVDAPGITQVPTHYPTPFPTHHIECPLLHLRTTMAPTTTWAAQNIGKHRKT